MHIGCERNILPVVILQQDLSLIHVILYTMLSSLERSNYKLKELMRMCLQVFIYDVLYHWIDDILSRILEISKTILTTEGPEEKNLIY